MENLSKIYQLRLEKLQNLQENLNYDPYTIHFHPENTCQELKNIKEELYSKDKIYSLGGRIRSLREMGKASFCDIEDHTDRLQLYISKDNLGEKFPIFRSVDLGDIVGVSGFLFKTRTGEKTLALLNFDLLAKCLHPLPVVKEADGKTFDAFQNQEQRYRQRYLDLILNSESRQTFVLRSQCIRHIRSYLEKKDYLEVETPSMQSIPGGASARPFVTYHNTLDRELFLRVAPELFLKRLIVGGFPKVFEIGRNYRNEGISPRHNPEFTMLELYEAYTNIDTMFSICEEIISQLVKKLYDQYEIKYENHKINFKPPWPRLSYLNAIKKYTSVSLDPEASLETAKKSVEELNLDHDELETCSSVWQLAELVFDKFVEKKLIQPTFITDYPLELSPLAKAQTSKAYLVQRFELIIAGRELANAFSELNNPIEQKKRFQEQLEVRQKAHEAGAQMDNDYIQALEYGMPPSGGMGIGIDRLVMLISNSSSIRDTILFPLLRSFPSENPENKLTSTTKPDPTSPKGSYSKPVQSNKDSRDRGYNKDSRDRGYNKDSRDRGYNKDSRDRGYNKNSRDRGYNKDSRDRGYNKDSRDRGYNKDSRDRSYNKDSRDRGYNKDSRDRGYNKDSRDRGYNKDSRDRGYNKNSRDRGYNKNSRDRGYNKDSRDRGYNKDSRDRGYNKDSRDRGYNKDSRDRGYNKDSRDRGYNKDSRDRGYNKNSRDRGYNKNSRDRGYNKDSRDRKSYSRPAQARKSNRF